MRPTLPKECASQKLRTRMIDIGMIRETTGIPGMITMVGIMTDGRITEGKMTVGVMTDGIMITGIIKRIMIDPIFWKAHGMNETEEKNFKLKTFLSGSK